MATTKQYWHQVMIPFGQDKKFKGVSIGYDTRPSKKGYFVFTHRARSKAYSSINRIPEVVIKKIETMG